MSQRQPTRELTAAPGFLCPACQQVHIKLSLPRFLSDSEVTCPGCGTVFQMDKSQCSKMVEMLQELQNADEAVQSLREQHL
jgi:transcription elongation factor Elf1